MLRRVIFPALGSCTVDYGATKLPGKRKRGLFLPIGPVPFVANFGLIFHSLNDIDVSAGVKGMATSIGFTPSGGYTGQFFSYLSFASAYANLAAATQIQWHVIGGGQGGFNGTQQPSSNGTPGGLGGEGASYASVMSGPGSFTVTIGDPGAANGGAGGDSFVQLGATTIALGRGGGSATANIGTTIALGGTAPARTTMIGFPVGMGGGGGGGAGGPNGTGGNGGDISPLQKLQSSPSTTTSDGGTGGGAGNGGKPGFTAAFAGTSKQGINSITGQASGFVPGDGGDQSTPTGYVLVNGGTVYGSQGIFGYNDPGLWGGGGPGGNSANITVRNYVDCNPWPANFPGPPYALNQRATDTTYDAFRGGAGGQWGILPQDFSTTIGQVFLNGYFAGSGGGGGGGAGGSFNNGSGRKRGRIGGPYGGGGGGGGNWVTGFSADGTGGAGCCGVVVALYK